jgi:hypothetical protein
MQQFYAALFMTLCINIYPAASRLSYDDKYLVFQEASTKRAVLFLINLPNRSITELNTKGSLVIPKCFSPRDNNLILCLGTKEGEKEKLSYGIFNVATGGFQPLKELSLRNPKYLLLVLFGFDWVDWR